MVTTAIVAAVCFIGGGGLAYMFFKYGLKSKYNSIIKEAETEAEVIKKNKLLEVKEKFFNLKSEHDKQVVANNAKMQQRELSLNQRQGELQRRSNELDATRKNLDSQLQLLDEKRKDLERSQKQVTDQLAAISGLSPEDAKAQLIESLKE